MTSSGAPIQITPEQAISEAAALGEKIARGAALFSKLRDEDVAIATTPKEEVWRQDKVSLHHYLPLADKRVAGAGADRLRVDRPLHNGRPAGGSLACP